MAGTPGIGPRTALRRSTAAGLSGTADVSSTTPGQSSGRTELEAPLGVSKRAGGPRAVVEADAPGDARVAHENGPLGDAVVSVSFPAAVPRQVGESHGTHTAGIAVVTTDNDEGIDSIGNSSLLSERALSEEEDGSASGIADAIEWAADPGADVASLSPGGGR